MENGNKERKPRMFKVTGYGGKKISDMGVPYAKKGIEYEPVSLIIGEMQVWFLNAYCAIND